MFNKDKQISQTDMTSFIREFLQQTGQQGAEQLSQAIQEVMGSGQDKTFVASHENISQDIGENEALKASIVTGNRSWDANVKEIHAEERSVVVNGNTNKQIVTSMATSQTGMDNFFNNVLRMKTILDLDGAQALEALRDVE